jgi:hypothetical protein
MTVAKTTLAAAAILIGLQAWAAHHEAVHAAHDGLHALTGAAPTCPLSEPAFAVLQAYTAQTAQALGDNAGILDWWVKDAKCRPADVEWPVGTHRHIAGLADLAELIAEAG